ncbi:MAG: c-type cytochrome [Pseudohongiellaceae bacterium]
MNEKKLVAVGLAGLISLSVLLASTTSFAASPRTNYLRYCSGCHLPDAQGAPPNVPSLHNELGRMMQVSQMRAYLVQVPGSAQAPISDGELAAVVNWLLSEYNSSTLPADFKPLTAEEVGIARQHILADPLQHRIRYWKDYDF